MAVLNYIPFLSGFYAEALDVLKTAWHGAPDAGVPFDLLVFDNGSCAEAQWLLDEQRAGRIQYLILSEKNLGKGGAWNLSGRRSGRDHRLCRQRRAVFPGLAGAFG